MVVFVVNCGSSSLRFQIVDVETRQRRVAGLVERIGTDSSLVTIRTIAGSVQREVTARSYSEALSVVVDYLNGRQGKAADTLEEVEAVGHRVVHGGENFSESVLIDTQVIRAIEEADDLAPLHNRASLEGILTAEELLPGRPQVAVFDTAFHQTMPRRAFLYGLPTRLHERHKIRRYGFHGISHHYVSRRVYQLSGIPEARSKLITCHLGSGASMTAIENGRSIDTSMGLTPLSGLIMGTRSGDIDPSVVFYLAERERMSLEDIQTLLNHRCGLLGLSSYAADMRLLIKEAQKGNPQCDEAIDLFCYRARAYIGCYFAVLNGCDGIVFTAGIGENSPYVRSRICQGLESLGIIVDEDLNQKAIGEELCISSKKSKVQVWVVPTDEELVIALDTMRLARERGRR